MPTTFHVANFKNATLNQLTGNSGSTTPISNVVPYNGVQPADPSATPAGTACYASYSYGPNMNTKISAAGGGVAQLSTPVAPANAAQAAAVSTLTFARIYSSSLPIIDTVVSLAGGGGGIILDSLTSNIGIGNNVTAFAIKMPNLLGTLSLSQSLADRLADMWGGGSSVTPNMGNTTGGACGITLYSGTAPSSADVPATGSVLAAYTISATNLWATAVGGASALAAAGPTVTASGTGTAGYFRMVKTNGAFTFTIQGTVGVTSGASDMILNTVALVSGVTSVQITDLTISI
jgi:hypothetical protein